MVTKKKFSFNSSDGIHKIKGICWQPEQGEIRGVLQLVHGMTEYIERYDDFAGFMCQDGFVVAGHDHLGHGGSVNSEDEWGYFAADKGFDLLVRDMYTLKKHMSGEYPNVPYFILGHSMGSFLTRIFISYYGRELSGAVIMGTGEKPVWLTKMGKMLTDITVRMRGDHYRSRFINSLSAGGFNKKFEPADTPYEWLTRDKVMIEKYGEDSRCTFMFTVGAYRDLFGGLLLMNSRERQGEIPVSLPVLIVSGAMDPVGGFGKEVTAVYEKYQGLGIENVELKLYDGARHEILNEINRSEVYQDILSWIMGLLSESK